MNISEIQVRVDALSKAMLAKAVPEPCAGFGIESDRGVRAHLSWAHKTRYRDYFHCDTLEEAEAYVAALPTPEEARMQAFMSSLSDTIELGKKVDVDADVVNPLLLLMERLSKNALTHQAQT